MAKKKPAEKKTKSPKPKKVTNPSKSKKSKSRRRLSLKKIFFGLLVAAVLIPTMVLAKYTKDLPSPSKLRSESFPVSTQIFDRNGTLLYEIFSDTHRTPVTLEDLPPYITQATIAIEDQDFYSHFGFSIQGIIRALKNTLLDDKLQGGSTITQQLVKNTLLTPERTIERKIKEAILTVGTEFRYSKDEILEMYLNHVPYGGTAYGIEAAAQRFFSKHAHELTLSESSLLAGLPQAPSLFSPYTNPEKAKARQHEVLRRMVEDEYVSQEEADQAFELELEYSPPSTDIKAPHFVFYVKDILEKEYGLQTVERGGLRVTTTLDLNLQEYAQASVSAQVEYLEDLKVSNGASLVTNPGTGEILAMVGSTDYFNTSNDGQVNLTNRLRQPGSSIKPINYVTALQTKTMHPSSLILDIPTCFNVTGQASYCPQNYDNSFHGPIQFRYAIANSYNIPAVKVLATNGLETMIATASAMGITTFKDPSQYGLSLTLGGGEVTMIDMATAFGTIANLGVKVPLKPILKVETYRGEVLYQYDPQETTSDLEKFMDESEPTSNEIGHTIRDMSRALNREPAYLMWHIMSDNQARAPVFGTRSDLTVPGKKVAAKTGTTNDWRDSWTLGFTPQYVVAAWVGNNDNSPMSYRVAGITGAAPIFNSIMTHLLQDVEEEQTELPQPEGVNGTNVCSLSGSYPTDDQPCDVRFEYYWKENFPESYNAIKKNIWVNKDTDRPIFTDNDDSEEPPNLENAELREHTVLSDTLVNDFCLDCNWLNPETGKFDYPKSTINMTTLDSSFSN